jgi:uncharacterized membrane protein
MTREFPAMKFVSKNILTGLITVLPVVLSIWLLYWAAVSTEAILGGWLRASFPDIFYFPGMGTGIALGGLFLVGILMHAYFVRRLFRLGEKILYHVPVLKTVYGAIRDFFTYFSPQGQQDFDQVVAVEFQQGIQVVGFVTCDDTARIPPQLQSDDKLLVYLPLSYAIGGYTVAVSRHRVKSLEMTMEEAMRFTLTGGVTGLPGTAQPGR